MELRTEVSRNKEETKTGEKQIIIGLWKELCRLVRRVDALKMISVNSLTLGIYLKEGSVMIEEVCSIDVQNEILVVIAIFQIT